MHKKELPAFLQGYFDHKKQPLPRTLCAQGPMVVLGGGRFLMGEVPRQMKRSCLHP